MIALTALTPNHWRAWRELRLQALEEAPYAFGSTLSEWQGPGDAEERWRSRLANVPFNAIAHFDGAPAGMVGATAPDSHGNVELISMWVAPFARGRGVGDALIQAVVDWARTQHARRVILGVVASNTRAVTLYRRNGFALTQDPAATTPCECTMARDL